MVSELTGTWIARIMGSPEDRLVLKVDEQGAVSGTYNFRFLTPGQGDVGTVTGVFHAPQVNLVGDALDQDPRWRWRGSGSLQGDNLKLTTFESAAWQLPGVVFRRADGESA